MHKGLRDQASISTDEIIINPNKLNQCMHTMTWKEFPASPLYYTAIAENCITGLNTTVRPANKPPLSYVLVEDIFDMSLLNILKKIQICRKSPKKDQINQPSAVPV